MMKKTIIKLCFCMLTILGILPAMAQDTDSTQNKKLSFGGYGEIVYQRFFYSDDFNRYLYPENYKSGYNRASTDLPHVVFFVAYDFGKGWKISSEIEFEHGGSGSTIEIEEEEFGEYEQEVEKGGEIALEQFWIEKSFSKAFNIRIGHFIVPVGASNMYHLPTEYFTVLRPEGESTILPLAWHETGISMWGKSGHWRYELQLINGLDAERFGSANWIKKGAVSPYEFKLATNIAGAARLDNFSISGLRLSLSGYYGWSAANSLKADRYGNLNGAVVIGAFDSEYKKKNLIARLNFVYGHLSDSEGISSINKTLPQDSPSPHSDVASDALCYSLDLGYNIMSFFNRKANLYPFTRYEYYNSMEKTEGGILANTRFERRVITAGINYFPIPQIVIKAEYSNRLFNSPYNNENTISLGIMYAGMFSGKH